jgi:plasmid stability protein
MNLLIRDLDEDTVKELEEQAKENNRSLEAELKAILEETVERGASFDSIGLVRRHRAGKP